MNIGLPPPFLHRVPATVTTTPADVINKHAILAHSRVRWVTAEPPVRRVFEHAARSHDILFIETPQYLDDLYYPSLDCAVAHPGVHRVVPHLPTAYRTSEAAALLATRTLLVELVGSTGALAHRFDHPIHWFDSPRPAPVMLGAFDECLVVYDPQDTPTLPWSAYTEWHRREQLLRARADVILSREQSGIEHSCNEHSSPEAVLQLIDQRIRTVRRNGRANAPSSAPHSIHSGVAR